MCLKLLFGIKSKWHNCEEVTLWRSAPAIIACCMGAPTLSGAPYTLTRQAFHAIFGIFWGSRAIAEAFQAFFGWSQDESDILKNEW